MLVVNDRVETCLSSPFPAHLKPIVKSVISSGGGNGSYQNQLGLLGCRVVMRKWVILSNMCRSSRHVQISYKHPKHPHSHQRPWILRFSNWFCLSQNQVIICHFARKIGWNIFPILLFILSKNRRWCQERIQWNNNTASWLMGWYDNISNKNLLLLKQHNSHRLDRISRSCVPAFV